jgi:hypothetical protein
MSVQLIANKDQAIRASQNVLNTMIKETKASGETKQDQVRLSKDEFENMLKAKRPLAYEALAQEVFSRIANNNSGHVTLNKLESYLTHMKRSITVGDRNKDSKLEGWEKDASASSLFKAIFGAAEQFARYSTANTRSKVENIDYEQPEFFPAQVGQSFVADQTSQVSFADQVAQIA